jgi:prepilin-type N-terminal cleavage/methylation domain-containing protein
MPARHRPACGFTLVEVLVVIAIILGVSALTLPTVVSSIAHRQVSEGARILQAALVGARDSAVRTNAPSGIRLVPDPTLNGVNPETGLVDPALILAANRFIPIEPAPDYSEGRVTVGPVPLGLRAPYPGPGGGYYPVSVPGAGVLLLEESVFDPSASAALANSPTSWYWNIRLGDRVQINNAGLWYTVVGPMTVTSAQGNSELFVNVGPPGTKSPLTRLFINPSSGQFTVYYPEFLFLVNGRDDNRNGWSDEGWDGVDNNGDGNVDELAEWETEQWTGAARTEGIVNAPYVVKRRLAPGANARAVDLPSQVVVDMTTWQTTRERSRLPVDPLTGVVDIAVNPDGSVVPTTIYSRPASFGMSSAFLHFWLAERGDMTAPSTSVASAPLLPLPRGVAPSRFAGAEIKGEYRLVSVFARTGRISTNKNMAFDQLPASSSAAGYDPNRPFVAAQQGMTNAP